VPPSVPEEQYQERFWRRKLYGIGLDTATKEFLAIEFKRTQDARSNYVERATALAQGQYKSLLTGLQAVGQVKGVRYRRSFAVSQDAVQAPRHIRPRVAQDSRGHTLSLDASHYRPSTAAQGRCEAVVFARRDRQGIGRARFQIPMTAFQFFLSTPIM
jgi:hypothetical protein